MKCTSIRDEYRLWKQHQPKVERRHRRQRARRRSLLCRRRGLGLWYSVGRQDYTLSTHTKWWGKGQATLASPPPDTRAGAGTTFKVRGQERAGCDAGGVRTR